MPDKEIRFSGNRVIGPGGGKPRPYISNVGVTLAVTRYCRPASTSPPPARIVLYITDSVLFQPLPIGFVRHLFRVVTYPGGSPLKIRTASTSSTVASSYSPAHALLVVTTFLDIVYHYPCEIYVNVATKAILQSITWLYGAMVCSLVFLVYGIIFVPTCQDVYRRVSYTANRICI